MVPLPKVCIIYTVQFTGQNKLGSLFEVITKYKCQVAGFCLHKTRMYKLFPWQQNIKKAVSTELTNL